MIQFNLLPDIKLQFVKANRIKRLAVVISSITATVLVGITIILVFSVKVIQARHITSLSNQITSSTNTLKNTPNLSQVLTIQNQLGALTSLHDQKPVASRIPTYLAELTPASATISKLVIDFSANTIQISGTADSLATVNTFVDTLKFSTYSTSSKSSTTKAFSNVVLAEFGYTSTQGATYEITASFAPRYLVAPQTSR